VPDLRHLAPGANKNVAPLHSISYRGQGLGIVNTIKKIFKQVQIKSIFLYNKYFLFKSLS